MKYFVFFDLDSTICKIEGLDYLAESKGKNHHIKEITEKAMNGQLPFRTALLEKLKLIRPSKKDFSFLSQAYLANISPGIKETIQFLKKKGAVIFIITGSFYPAVLPLAEVLGIKEENLFANKIFFDEDGNFKDIDLDNPLSRNGGKLEIVKKILSPYNPKPYSIFIGDSVTDLETKEIVNLFIGYGGVKLREKVKKESDFFVKDLKEIVKLLKPVL